MNNLCLHNIHITDLYGALAAGDCENMGNMMLISVSKEEENRSRDISFFNIKQKHSVKVGSTQKEQ